MLDPSGKWMMRLFVLSSVHSPVEREERERLSWLVFHYTNNRERENIRRIAAHVEQIITWGNCGPSVHLFWVLSSGPSWRRPGHVRSTDTTGTGRSCRRHCRTPRTWRWWSCYCRRTTSSPWCRGCLIASWCSCVIDIGCTSRGWWQSDDFQVTLNLVEISLGFNCRSWILINIVAQLLHIHEYISKSEWWALYIS